MVLDEHLCDELVVTRCSRVPDRFDGQPVRPEPFGGPAMDPRRCGRIRRGELGLRVLGEQRMDAEPASTLQPRDEQVGALELGQLGRRIGAFQHGVAEIRGELAENRGALEKRAAVVVE